MSGALEGLRVIELADEKGEYCGRLLAGMGADVVKVEPPGGAPTRRFPPFAGDDPDPEKSLHFWHYNVGKRSVTLDLESAGGRELFARLCERADVLVETLSPGALDALGLGYESLAARNPRLVVASITPFGQSGPLRDAPASDLTLMALGGSMAVCGYNPPRPGEYDTPPLSCEANQAYQTASVYAAHAILAAVLHVEAGGEGQHADVSILEAAASITEWHLPTYVFTGNVVPRGILGMQFEAKDGVWVSTILADFLGPRLFDLLLEILEPDGLDGELRADVRLRDPAYRNRNPERVQEALRGFCALHTSDEIYRIGQSKGFPWAPIRTPDENLDDPHLRDRGFFVEVDHPELGRAVPYPGGPFVASRTPWGFARRPPRLGEHDREIYGELGLGEAELARLRSS
ncbi:MAG: CaiB/BaiF CoA transferase family protein [Candidatus Binatia bacterium]